MRDRNVKLILSLEYIITLDKHKAHQNRLALFANLSHHYGLLKLPFIEIIAPKKASKEDLLDFHTEEYINCLEEYNEFNYEGKMLPTRIKERLDYFNLIDDCPCFHGIYDYVQYVAGGTLTAIDQIIKGSNTVVNFGGGRHHSLCNQANGFCYVNDIILGILKLAKQKIDNEYQFERILYIDFDLHHGDAVQEAFYTSDRVFTLSFHHFKDGFFPGTGQLKDIGQNKGIFRSLNIPLKEGINDYMYVKLFQNITKAVVDYFNPNVIIIQAGVDALATDKFSVFNITSKGLGQCLHHLLYNINNIPCLILGGGGYDPASVARTWTHFLAISAQIVLKDDLPNHSQIMYYKPSFTLHTTCKNRENLNSNTYIQTLIKKVRFYFHQAILKNPIKIK